MANVRKDLLDTLETRLVEPRRVALFGHRAVGKTTLLAMLYRQASTGQIPGVRLAAADPSTAEYLADRISQIEAGESPAGTLAETTLRLQLYQGQSRLDLMIKDYQGENVTLGSDAPIQEFFADCDAVLLCLDAEAAQNSTHARRRQQEVEALLERCQDRAVDGHVPPFALLVTRFDRVSQPETPTETQLVQLVEARFGMTRHALEQQSPGAAMFALSSYGPGSPENGRPPSELRPTGLAAPLTWLAEQLEQIDTQRLNRLFSLAPSEPARLGRCLLAFERRYPSSPAIHPLKHQLDSLQRRHWLLRGTCTALAAGVALAGLAGYDAWGYHATLKYEQSGQPATSVETQWNSLVAQHPTLPVFFPEKARLALKHRDQWQVRAATLRISAGSTDPTLPQQIQRIKEQAPDLAPEIARAEQAQQEATWKSLQVADVLAVEEPATHLAGVRRFLREFPDTPHKAAAVALAEQLEMTIAKREATDDRAAIDRLNRTMSLPGVSWRDLIEETRQLLNERPNSPYRAEIEELLEAGITRLDEAEIERARQFSRTNPANYTARREKYTDYLRAHGQDGKFVTEARQAIQALDRERDLTLYRQAYEHQVTHPDDVPAIAGLLRGYLETSPSGEFAAAAQQYLHWWERISTEDSYRVTLKRGRVEPGAGKLLAGAGPDLSVTITVAGVEYGPSPVIRDTRTPIWEYSFPSPVRWKYGDPVTIKIQDHDWNDTNVFTFTTSPGDKLAMRLLSGTVRPVKGGKTELRFRSDFQEPALPRPE